ncbi:MAG: hypothetical protein MAG451_01568 [Anaerolineales bacterium]|nr:hypothetical protein [Anaerolineales bacterium]
MAAPMQQQVRSAQDRELDLEVERALQRYDPIRSSGSPIQVSTENGVVTLTGLARSRTMKLMAEKMTCEMPGVADVRNQLLTDTDIASSVASEFATNERLRPAGGIIRVKSILGEVYLAGDVAADSVEEAEELRALAERLAEGTSGVTRVINSVVARERGQAVAAVTEEEEAGGLTAVQEADLDELRERRSAWSERAAAQT